MPEIIMKLMKLFINEVYEATKQFRSNYQSPLYPDDCLISTQSTLAFNWLFLTSAMWY